MNLDLTGKTAVVCGSTQGIGFATATELANMGARVFLVSRNQQALEEAKSKLPTPQHQEHGILVADFQHPETLESALDQFLKDHTAHILVNNTGGPPAGNAIDAQIEEFRIAFNQHLICNHILATRLVPGMKSSGYGRIINVISTSVKQPPCQFGRIEHHSRRGSKLGEDLGQ